MKTSGKWEFDEPTRRFIAKIKARPFVPPESKPKEQIAVFFTGDALVEIPVRVIEKAGWRRA